VCLAVLTSVVTGFLMWWKRRPTGGTGAPGRASATTRAATPKQAVVTVAAVAVVLSVLYPVFGVSLLVVVAVEALLGHRRRTRGADVVPESAAEGVVASDDGDDVPAGVLQ
jgi:uncharacterized iron-regulated membrane protein